MDASPFPLCDAAPDFPALRAAAQARAAASPTAQAQARLLAERAAGGAFERVIAATCRGWGEGQRAVYPAILGGVEGHGARAGSGVEGGSVPARGQK